MNLICHEILEKQSKCVFSYTNSVSQNEICNTKQVDCIAYISSLPQLSVYMLTTAMPELV